MKKLIAAFLITVAAGAASVAHAAEKVTVFAAASMKDVIEEAAKQIKAKDGTEVVASFASSSVLAKQIEQGAPAQIFISADLDWMDYVEKADLIDKASRKVLAVLQWVIRRTFLLANMARQRLKSSISGKTSKRTPFSPKTCALRCNM
jgi:ABC-type molybdate transport system substrate-binding protein